MMLIVKNRSMYIIHCTQCTFHKSLAQRLHRESMENNNLIELPDFIKFRLKKQHHHFRIWLHYLSKPWIPHLQTKAKCACIEETQQNYSIRRYDYLNPRNDKCADFKTRINIKLMNCVSSFGWNVVGVGVGVCVHINRMSF